MTLKESRTKERPKKVSNTRKRKDHAAPSGVLRGSLKESRELKIKVNGELYVHADGGRVAGQCCSRLITSTTCRLEKQYERPRLLTGILLKFALFSSHCQEI